MGAPNELPAKEIVFNLFRATSKANSEIPPTICLGELSLPIRFAKFIHARLWCFVLVLVLFVVGSAYSDQIVIVPGSGTSTCSISVTPINSTQWKIGKSSSSSWRFYTLDDNGNGNQDFTYPGTSPFVTNESTSISGCSNASINGDILTVPYPGSVTVTYSVAGINGGNSQAQVFVSSLSETAELSAGVSVSAQETFATYGTCDENGVYEGISMQFAGSWCALYEVKDRYGSTIRNYTLSSPINGTTSCSDHSNPIPYSFTTGVTVPINTITGQVTTVSNNFTGLFSFAAPCDYAPASSANFGIKYLKAKDTIWIYNNSTAYAIYYYVDYHGQVYMEGGEVPVALLSVDYGGIGTCSQENNGYTYSNPTQCTITGCLDCGPMPGWTERPAMRSISVDMSTIPSAFVIDPTSQGSTLSGRDFIVSGKMIDTNNNIMPYERFRVSMSGVYGSVFAQSEGYDGNGLFHTDGNGNFRVRVNTKQGYYGSNHLVFTHYNMPEVTISTDVFQSHTFNNIAPNAKAGDVELNGGQLNLSINDISVAGRGLSLNFTRYYHTRGIAAMMEWSDGEPPLDNIGNWSHSYDVFLQDFDTTVYVKSSQSRMDVYTFKENDNGVKVYNPPRGMYSVLKKNTDNSFTLTEKDGTVYFFGKNSLAESDTGSSISLWQLTEIRDRCNNRICLYYKDIAKTGSKRISFLDFAEDDLGRRINLIYDTNRKISAISLTAAPDAVGNRAELKRIDYQITDGNLVNVTVEGDGGSTATYYYGNNLWGPSVMDFPAGFLTGYDDIRMPKGQRNRFYKWGQPFLADYNDPEWRVVAESTMDDIRQEWSEQNGPTVYSFEHPLFTIDYNAASFMDTSSQMSTVTVYNSKNNPKTFFIGKNYYAANTNDTIYLGETDALGNHTDYQWDYWFNLTKQIDPNGRYKIFTYDNKGNMTHSLEQSSGPNGGSLIASSYYDYDSKFNQCTKETDLLGNAKKYDYDTTNGCLITTWVQNPTGPSTNENLVVAKISSYNEHGQVISTTTYNDGNLGANYGSNTTMYDYDPVTGQQSKVMSTVQYLDSSTENVTNITNYDALSRKISTVDPAGLSTYTYYDILDRVVRVVNTDGGVVTNTYNERGNLWKVTDPNGIVTENIYDNGQLPFPSASTFLDRLTDVYAARSTADEVHTHNVYDSEGNVTQTTIYRQAGNIVNNFTYDVLNRLSTKSDSVNGVARTTSNTYDNLGRLSTVVDCNGTMITKTYDDLDHVLSTVETKSGQTLTQTFTYNPIGTLLSATTDGSAGTTAYTYDNLYRVITAQVTGGGANQLNTLTTYAYDLAGNKRSMSYATNADSGTMNISYDYYANGWMKSVNNDGNVTYYDYYKTSEKKLVKYPNNTETAYEYNCYSNPNNLTSKMNHYLLKMTNRRTTDKAVISFFGYPEYDLLGNRLKMNELRGQHVYAYDNLYRLKAVTYPDTRNVNYTYDEAGNRTSMVETEKTGATPVTTAYQYNEVNEMMSLTKGTDTTNYTYDQDGNTLTKANTAGTTYYHWNLKGELSATELPGNKSNVMEYDANGMRIRYTTADNVTTNYVYEGLGTVMEIVGTRVTKKYYSGISMVIPENPGKSCKQTYYYLYDGLGDVVNLTDEAGNLVQTYYFDAFGKSTNVKHDPVNKKQFTGKEIDEDSGLHYFGARYYDAEVGRFLSEDPVFHENLYVYCDNNPINRTDPDGRSWKSREGIFSAIGAIGSIAEGISGVALLSNPATAILGVYLICDAGVGAVSNVNNLIESFDDRYKSSDALPCTILGYVAGLDPGNDKLRLAATACDLIITGVTGKLDNPSALGALFGRIGQTGGDILTATGIVTSTYEAVSPEHDTINPDYNGWMKGVGQDIVTFGNSTMEYDDSN